MRNVIEQAEKGKATIKENQELSLEEFRQILNIYNNTVDKTGKDIEGIWDVVDIAYHMGYAVGSKQS